VNFFSLTGAHIPAHPIEDGKRFALRYARPHGLQLAINFVIRDIFR
jgi:hypothetical protein